MLLFAAWTVLYHLGLLIRPPTWALLAAWTAVAATALWAGGRLRRRPGGLGALPGAAGVPLRTD
ncbi:hypothetical protein, partial [Actinomadura roseirufa]|uniref:hypothetical protein n=1 Tax=Actinomadura roseirufa TaxID=2094049 RepID=UPI001041AEF4